MTHGHVNLLVYQNHLHVNATAMCRYLFHQRWMLCSPNVWHRWWWATIQFHRGV